jgi:hypothetical protein
MHFKHGFTKTRTYKSWRAMREKCLNPKDPSYSYYGERGIGICKEWDSFETFLADIGIRPEGHSLDRIDNTKGYSKDNCRWASSITQSRNRSVVKQIAWNGKTKTIREWANQLQVSDITLRKRLKKWSLERAMTEPVDISKNSKR